MTESMALGAEACGSFSLTRASGEMPSVLDQPAGRAEFFRCEAMLNDVIPNPYYVEPDKLLAGRR
jgi:hypothetical protein